MRGKPQPLSLRRQRLNVQSAASMTLPSFLTKRTTSGALGDICLKAAEEDEPDDEEASDIKATSVSVMLDPLHDCAKEE